MQHTSSAMNSNQTVPQASDTPKSINLALQGGGAHGALTWGVLDRLLEDPRLAIAEISGTSAGAMNAVVLADGHGRGGPAEARRALARFWRATSDAAKFSPIQRTPLDRMLGRFTLDYAPGYLWVESLSRFFSPYDINPLGLNPLRDVLEDCVDFEAVRRSDVAVHVTATNVRSGRARIFSGPEITADAVMASACLPQLYPAVQIGGEEYWDGGYSGNPALQPLVQSERCADILIVQINPVIRHKPPRSAREIINRMNEISFNGALVKELRAIQLMQEVIEAKGIDLGVTGRTFLHLIHVDQEVNDLSASSKMNAEWYYLQLLFDKGRRWADEWLGKNYDRIGAGSTLELDEFFDDAPRALGPRLTD
jgi:NTE family protein